ncbi:MFS transporter [Zooshikella marina]|uniref:MFS transporter n=1 Tax=Zooshikella ganghwensis TaxID=202772 RepID=UPI001BAF82E9|nr:MFS transporter [Zooshikella ganghwensis]MBU2706700.1 MFS transporter [Zooshikella ganghwensis]
MVYSPRDVKLIRLASIPWGFLLLNGITFPFLIYKGLSVSEVFIIQSVLSLSVVVTEVPSGLFTDKFGNKTALIVAGMFKGIGGMMVWAMEGFWPMIIAWIFIGLANSFYSGTNMSVIYRSSLKQEKKTVFVSDIYQWGNFSFYIAIFLGAWISKYSIDLAALINGIVACTPALIFAFISRDSRFTIEQKDNKDNKDKEDSIFTKIKMSLTFSLHKGHIISLFIFSAIFCIIVRQSTNIVQIFLMDKGFEVQHIGLIVGGLGLLGLAVTKLISKKVLSLSIRQTLILIAALVLSALALFKQGFVLVFIVGVLVLEVVKYLLEVYIVDSINRSYKGKMIASLNSVLSLVKRFAVMLFAPVIGIMIETKGFETTLTNLTYFYILMSAIVIAAIVFYSLKKPAVSENSNILR